MALDYRISLQKLEVFCLVVELRGVGRAAEHLCVAQPVVSAHLRTLQERIGAQLLYRDGQQMRLTEAGEVAYAGAKEILSRSEEVSREIEDLADGAAGSAVVASSMTLGSYLLPPVLNHFRRSHPRARLTLHVSDPERALHAAEIGVADFALVVTDAVIEQRAFHSEAIASEELVLVASPQDTQVGDTVTQAELQGLRYVCSPAGLARRRLVDAALRAIGVQERDIVIEYGHPEALKLATQSGMGVTLLLRASVERELRAGTLRSVEIEGVDRLAIPITFVRRSGKRLSPLQIELADAIREALADNDPAGPPETVPVSGNGTGSAGDSQ